MSSNRKNIMNDSLNPFDRILENFHYPLARIYRESFWQGIADTYDVFAGNHYRMGNNEDTHAGIVDIFIFPLLSQWLMRIAFPRLKNIIYEEQPTHGDKEIRTYVGPNGVKSQKVIYKTPAAPMPIRIMAGIVAGLLEGPRAIIAGGLTLLVSPIVAIVHLVTSYKAHKLRNQVQEVDIQIEKRTLEETATGESSYKSIVVAMNKLKNTLGDNNLTDISANRDRKNAYKIKRNKYREYFSLTKPDGTSKPEKAFQKLNIGGRKIR